MGPPGVRKYSPAVRTGPSQSSVSDLDFEPRKAPRVSKVVRGVIAKAITPPSLLDYIFLRPPACLSL